VHQSEELELERQGGPADSASMLRAYLKFFLTRFSPGTSSFNAERGQCSHEQPHGSQVHTHMHIHNPLVLLPPETMQKRIAVLLLEIGIATHSIIIGVALGVAANDDFVPLLMALSCHQFFEGYSIITYFVTCSGIALGSTVVDAAYSAWKSWMLVGVYGVTTPIGILVGIVIHSTYNGNSTSALLVQGIFDSVSGGVLIYMALVELISVEVTHNHEMRKEWWVSQALQFFALYAGVVIMAVIGRWA
jgi:zinc transporter 1/2/3